MWKHLHKYPCVYDCFFETVQNKKIKYSTWVSKAYFIPKEFFTYDGNLMMSGVDHTGNECQYPIAEGFNHWGYNGDCWEWHKN